LFFHNRQFAIHPAALKSRASCREWLKKRTGAYHRKMFRFDFSKGIFKERKKNLWKEKRN